MARLLIKAADANHPDPTIDKRSSYKVGDVVVVVEDGHVWGGAEGLPAFLQLDVPGLGARNLGYLAAPDKERPEHFTSAPLRKIPGLFSQVARNTDRKTLVRRQFSIDLTGINFVDGYASVDSPTEINKRNI